MKRRSAIIRTKSDPPRRPRIQRVQVLIVLSADGFAEVFGNDEIDAHVVTLLAGENIPAVEVLAEQFLEREIPRRFRSLFFRPKLRASGSCRRRTVAGEIEARRKLRIIRELRKLREVYSK